MLKVLVNVVTCSAIGFGNSSNTKTAVDVKGDLFPPVANKLNIDVKRWYHVLIQEKRHTFNSNKPRILLSIT